MKHPGYVIKTQTLIHCGMFAALTAAGAFIKIPVPLVPFTLQFLFTNMAGLLLGSKKGAAAVGVYLLLGLAGLPVFAEGGGLAYIFKPSFGYLIGFVIGAYVTGRIAEAEEGSFYTYLKAGFAGLFVVYAFGMTYYYLIANYYLPTSIGVWSLILYGFLLAVPGDILICIVSAALAKRVVPLIKNYR